jgi:hypothetical protein
MKKLNLRLFNLLRNMYCNAVIKITARVASSIRRWAFTIMATDGLFSIPHPINNLAKDMPSPMCVYPFDGIASKNKIQRPEAKHN